MSRRPGAAGRALLALLLVAVATACAAQPSPPGEPVTPSATSSAPPADTSPAPADPAPPEPSPPGAAGVPGPPVDVATGLDVPWSIAQLPDGDVLVSLRDEARVVRVSPAGEVVDVVATGEDGRVPDVENDGEGGLLGLALSPGFTEDATLYAYRTTAGGNQVVRMRLDGDRLGGPEVLVDGIPRARVHNGGRLAFGPDGMLYATTGDAGDTGASQDTGSLGGKILRVTPDGGVPPDNPVDGSPVWSWGHRNVQGIGWDAQGRLFASEFGQNALDELNLVEPGGNYGWPLVEGGGGRDGLADPLLTWSTEEASPSGLAVTSDAVYLAALRGQRLWRVPLADGAVGTPEAFLSGELGRLRDVVVAPDGGLLLLTNNTTGDPRDGDDRLVSVPLG